MRAVRIFFVRKVLIVFFFRLCFSFAVLFVLAFKRVEVTGIFRAVPKRLNPKMRVVRAVYKTYVDVIHFRCRYGTTVSKFLQNLTLQVRCICSSVVFKSMWSCRTNKPPNSSITYYRTKTKHVSSLIVFFLVTCFLAQRTPNDK